MYVCGCGYVRVGVLVCVCMSMMNVKKHFWTKKFQAAI